MGPRENKPSNCFQAASDNFSEASPDNSHNPINKWPANERPREKLLSRGSQALTDAELLAIFINTGTNQHSALDISRSLLKEADGLAGLMRLDTTQLQAVKGLGPAKAAKLKAISEIASRVALSSLSRGQALTSPQATKTYLQSQLRHETVEVFWALMLDNQHRIISSQAICRGTIDSATVYPREVLKLCLSQNAAAVIFAHNHPSGSLKVSDADHQITAKLKHTLNTVDIRLLDHIIVADSGCTSMAEMGLI